MAKSVNKVILLGNVGKDPEIRTLRNDVKVASFSLATTERFKDKAGEWKDQTEWHNLTAFARIAEVIEQYVHKGDKLYIEGKLETRSWDDPRSGEKKYQTQVKITELVLLSSRPDTDRQPAPASADEWDEFH